MPPRSSNNGGPVATPTGKPPPQLTFLSMMVIVASVAAFLGLTRVPMPPSLPTGPITRPPEFRLLLDKDSVLHITKLRGDPVEIRTYDGHNLCKVYGRPSDPGAPPGTPVEGFIALRMILLRQIVVSPGHASKFRVVFRGIDPALNQPLSCDLVTISAEGEIKHHHILIEQEVREE